MVIKISVYELVGERINVFFVMQAICKGYTVCYDNDIWLFFVTLLKLNFLPPLSVVLKLLTCSFV